MGTMPIPGRLVSGVAWRFHNVKPLLSKVYGGWLQGKPVFGYLFSGLPFVKKKLPVPCKRKAESRLVVITRYTQSTSSPSHPFSPSFCRFGLFLFLLHTGFVIKTPFLHFRKEPFFGELPFKIFNRLFYLIVLHDDFHIFIYLNSLNF